MGFAKAQYQLGRAYEKGYGVAKSDKTAVKYYKMAAEQGHAKSQYQLGRAYDKGDGVKEDDAKAFQWYSKAAQQGNAKAQYQLGRCYKKGEGCTKDANAAFQWFEKSAAQGNADAQLALGNATSKARERLRASDAVGLIVYDDNLPILNKEGIDNTLYQHFVLHADHKGLLAVEFAASCGLTHAGGEVGLQES